MTKRVNPVPSVPATPAKQNPNPTDNVRRRPDDQGFQSILDKYTKDKPMMKTVAAKAVKGHEKRLHGMAKGGGIEVKGKTKGTMIKMKSGGKAC